MSEPAGRRPRLNRERVLRAAIEVADRGGIASLTMRSLAEALGAKPMSVYHYVATKGEILDGIVDLVFTDIDLPSVGGEWRAEIHRRAVSARQVLRKHPWAIGLLETRTTPGPATLRHHDAVLGTLLHGGFSLAMTAHAYALIDSYTYGFALQEAALPFQDPESGAEVAGPIMDQIAAGEYPHLTEMSAKYYLQPGYDFGDEFELGLNLILDGLAAWLPPKGRPEVVNDCPAAAR